MPHEWNNILVVTKEELVPHWYSWANLKLTIHRYAQKNYGIKRVQLGGNGRQMLVAFDSLPKHIQEGLGDPRKESNLLEKYYRVDREAVTFYATYKFHDGSYLDTDSQEKYILNASVLNAALLLKGEMKAKRKALGMNQKNLSKVLSDTVNHFQKILKLKHNVQHTLPKNKDRFNRSLNEYNKQGYGCLISGKHKNGNSRKVTDITLELLKNMFAGVEKKPTATEVARKYNTFLSGYLEVINNETGEVYSPSGFKKLSDQTVTRYMAEWENAIGTEAKRSGDRQKLQQKFKPYHSLEKPAYAGSIISIDDRQPPFKTTDGKRVWFYNGIDLGSEAFTCWVYGRDKEGIILEFYRQLIRNYAEWGVNLPAELEAEMSLNSSFTNTFLREGAMFQYVRIEANNARGKRIEAYYKQLRYGVEKDRAGWLARPHAVKESNQAGPEKALELPYNEIIEGCLRDIEKWNNQPHSVHTHMTRWEVFLKMQNPDLKPTNYLSILPYIGYKTPTSCNAGIIKLQRKEFLLGSNQKVAVGENLISLMKQVEGKDVALYWLDDNEGNVLKALVFINNQFICEAVPKPTYNRARIEQTDQDRENREIMSAYVATIEGYARRQKQSINRITIIDNNPEPKKLFVMRGLSQAKRINEWQEPEVLEELPISEEFNVPTKSFARSIQDRF